MGRARQLKAMRRQAERLAGSVAMPAHQFRTEVTSDSKRPVRGWRVNELGHKVPVVKMARVVKRRAVNERNSKRGIYRLIKQGTAAEQKRSKEK